MQDITIEDRQKELNALRKKVQDHPERDCTEQSKRMRVLNALIARK